MRRKIYLEGELGEKFGKEHDVVADSVVKALRCVYANHPELRNYLLQADINYAIDVAGEDVEELDLKSSGDITVTPIPEGSKSAGRKLIYAAIIATILIVSAGTAGAAGGNLFYAVSAEGAITFTTTGLIASGIAVNLALAGIQQLLLPDPSTDKDNSQSSYLFNGTLSNIQEGDPMPLLYGELRVPGAPLSLRIDNSVHVPNNPIADGLGNLVLT